MSSEAQESVVSDDNISDTMFVKSLVVLFLSITSLPKCKQNKTKIERDLKTNTGSQLWYFHGRGVVLVNETDIQNLQKMWRRCVSLVKGILWFWCSRLAEAFYFEWKIVSFFYYYLCFREQTFNPPNSSWAPAKPSNKNIFISFCLV